jgi:hypothetical protein
MKQNILIILSSLFILTNASFSQTQCIVWTDDYGNEQQAKLRSLRSEIRYYNVQKQVAANPKIEYRDMLLLKNAARNVEMHKQSEYAIVRNKCFTSTTKQPPVYTK